MDRYKRSFPPDAAAVRAARAFAREALATWGVPSDDVIMVVGELTTNAVVHADSPFVLSLRRRAHSVVAEVTDNSPDVPRAMEPDQGGLGGRGLGMVETVALAWGFHSDLDGQKVVWAEIRV